MDVAAMRFPKQVHIAVGGVVWIADNAEPEK